jgi:hypothetical protein
MRIILDLSFENDYHSCRCHMNPSSNSSHGTLSLIKLITCLATLVSSVVFFMSKEGRQIFAPCKICISHIHVGRIARWQGQFFALGNCSLHCSNMYIHVLACKNCISTIRGGHAKEGICPRMDGIARWQGCQGGYRSKDGRQLLTLKSVIRVNLVL